MKKIVNPCFFDSGDDIRKKDAFVSIEFKNGKLSLSGVIAPRANGNCDRAGQCVDAIRKGTPAKNWNEEMLQKFCDIWDEWHLNDMCPYCTHQKELGWDKLASKKVTMYYYRLTSEALSAQRDAENAALAALKNGETFTPTKEQHMFAALPFEKVSHEEELHGELSQYYEPRKRINGICDSGPTTTESLGWLRPETHPDGILGKPCPVCGYKYGSAWLKKEVPEDVINWLFSLPNTTQTPAWV